MRTVDDLNNQVLKTDTLRQPDQLRRGAYFVARMPWLSPARGSSQWLVTLGRIRKVNLGQLFTIFSRAVAVPPRPNPAILL